jgi:hypothetical protein
MKEDFTAESAEGAEQNRRAKQEIFGCKGRQIFRI